MVRQASILVLVEELDRGWEGGLACLVEVAFGLEHRALADRQEAVVVLLIPAKVEHQHLEVVEEPQAMAASHLEAMVAE